MPDIRDILQDIKEKYLADNRPWIVGFSGGKDSTALLQLVYVTVQSLPEHQRNKFVHVLCSDTGVEPPNVIAYLDSTLQQINDAAAQHTIPLRAAKVGPVLKDRFFVKIIGRGYPAPNKWFRWCTDRMKIRPSNAYILSQIEQHGEVVVLLGVRNAESAARAQTIRNNEMPGTEFHKHQSLPKAYVYSPIKEMETQEVWRYLTQFQCPWGGNHQHIVNLYRKAGGDRECPVVFDGSKTVCGGSRFGCWTCTVVATDKSMQGFVDSGEDWMEPLLDYRNWLAKVRNDLSMRESRQRNGRESPGPFTMVARQELLRRLCLTELDVGFDILADEEMQEIDRLWRLDGYAGASVQEVRRQLRDDPKHRLMHWTNERVLEWRTSANLPILQAATSS